MLENLEALRALAQTGTMTEAATRLRLTQSAVSKRIAALEREAGKPLIEPIGRRVRLTPAGVRLLERTEPLLADLKAALREERAGSEGRIVLAVSESVLSSWGPAALARARARLPGLELRIHAHRSLAAIDRVRSGDAMLALCAGVGDTAPDLQAELLLEEELVIVPSGLDLEALEAGGQSGHRPGEPLPVMTIEPHSATWTWLERRLRRLSRETGVQIEVEHTLQSFPCLVQMARAGFGHALAPLELARAFGISEDRLYRLPGQPLTRPVSVVGRASTLGQPVVRAFVETLRETAEARFREPPGHSKG